MKEKDATSSLFGEPFGDALTAAPTRKSIRRSARKLSRRWTRVVDPLRPESRDAPFNGSRAESSRLKIRFGSGDEERPALMKSIDAGLQDSAGRSQPGGVVRLRPDRQIGKL